MKITVKPKEIKSEEVIVFGEIKSGMVFKYQDGTIGLKLKNNEAVLLNYSGGITYLDLAKGYRTSLIKKILGRLDEIIVVEEE